MLRRIRLSVLMCIGLWAIAALTAMGLVSCGGSNAPNPKTASASDAPSLIQAPAQAELPAAITAQAVTAPVDGATISGLVYLEVRGSDMANVELLPATGYTPKYATFAISSDKATATATLDTTQLPDGPLTVRISAFSTPPGSSSGTEVIAMAARTWSIQNSFVAQVTAAPTNGATISGNVTLIVKGAKLGNVELLPPNSYLPKYAVFTISADKTTATATLDTTKFSDGAFTARIVAYDAPAGSPTANQITAMPARIWNINNSIFSAQVTSAPVDGATLSGTVNFTVNGTNMRRVELLPPGGYTPLIGAFTISADYTLATFALDTTKLPEGPFKGRIVAYYTPPGSPTTSEIVAMPPRSWYVNNKEGPFAANLLYAPENGETVSGIVTLEVVGSKLSNVELVSTAGGVIKLASFTVWPDGKRAVAIINTRLLPKGVLIVQIRAYDALPGNPANEIVVMPARTWIIQ